MSDTTGFTTDDLTLAMQPRSVAAGCFVLQVPQGWQQGRGAFGGLVLGALASAIERSEPEPERAMRSLSGEICGPVLAGEATIEVAGLRRGSAVSTLSATLSQGGEVLAHATAVLGRTRLRDRSWSPSPPQWSTGEEAPWAGVPPVPADQVLEGLGGPSFIRYFEIRPTGPLPYSGGAERVSAGWLRPRRAPAALGAPEIIALTDCFWPGLLATETARRPVSTVAFTVQLFPPVAPLDPALPVFHRACTVAAQDGYAVELRELWSAGGQLLSLNQQTFVIIK